jgi:hypothetical protein
MWNHSLDCAVECAVDTRKQPVQDSKTGGRGVAIPQAEHTKRGQPVLRWPPFRVTLNQEVVGSNPTWPTMKFKGLADFGESLLFIASTWGSKIPAKRLTASRFDPGIRCEYVSTVI